MSSEEQDQWKARWLPKGLPETLLNDMIVEANLEYEAELQYAPYNTFATLGVIINDLDPEEDCYYFITIQRANEVFQGIALLEPEHLFAEIPITEVVAQVFKLKYDVTLEAIAFGYAIFNHTKDDSVTVNVNTIQTPPPPTNRIFNPSFEMDLFGWALLDGDLPDVTTYSAYEGTKSVRQKYSGGYMRWFWLYQELPNIDSNIIGECFVWAKRTVNANQVLLRIDYDDETWSEVQEWLTDSWTKYSLTVDPDKIIVRVRVGIVYSTSLVDINDRSYIDLVSLIETA